MVQAAGSARPPPPITLPSRNSSITSQTPIQPSSPAFSQTPNPPSGPGSLLHTSSTASRTISSASSPLSPRFSPSPSHHPSAPLRWLIANASSSPSASIFVTAIRQPHQHASEPPLSSSTTPQTARTSQTPSLPSSKSVSNTEELSLERDKEKDKENKRHSIAGSSASSKKGFARFSRFRSGSNSVTSAEGVFAHGVKASGGAINSNDNDSQPVSSSLPASSDQSAPSSSPKTAHLMAKHAVVGLLPHIMPRCKVGRAHASLVEEDEALARSLGLSPSPRDNLLSRTLTNDENRVFIYDSLEDLPHSRGDFDAVFVCCSPTDSSMDASQVCEAIISFIESPKPLSPEAKPIRAIVLDPFLTRKLNAMHARDLIEKAERGSVWVAMMTRWGNSSTRSDEEALSTAKTLADECAKGLAENRLSCPRFDWDESMAVIEALDEARSAETNHAPLSTRVVASVADTAQTHGAKPSPRLGVLDDLPEVDPEGPSSETQVVKMGEGEIPMYGLSGTQSADEDASGQSLRAQLQEMRHILRQKNALIAVLEQQGRNSSSAGLTGGESRVAGTTLAKNSRSSLPAFGLGLSTSVASSGNVGGSEKREDSPLDSPSRTRTPTRRVSVSSASTPKRAPSPALSNSSASGGRRNRKDSNDSMSGSLSPPISSVNQFESGLNSVTGLKTVKESNRNMALASSAEGFLSPTIASESRRVATLTQQANGVLAVTNISPNHNGGNGGPHSPNGAGQGSGTSRVIHQLTTELQETRQSLEATKSLLRTSQRSCSALQRQLEETKESLSRSRLENDTNSQMMARKERQASEALERARKAEAEVKELGRSSRVWGTRVREVEEQLGEERRLKGKAEAQYEALASSWKTTRESFVKDVEGLRDDVRLKNEENLRNANRLLEVKREMEEAFSVKEGEKERLKEVLEGLEAQKIAIEKFIQGSVGQLVERLEKYERLGQEQQEEVSGVSSELKRILRLMRSGEVSSSSVVG